uniref:Uncharacterized protein n=1 Tax=Glossina pallidipes TaxID=7398 RepID=A0A1B0ACF0_GLOPL
MNVASYRQSVNETLQAFVLQIEEFLEVFWKTIKQIHQELSQSTSWESPIEFTDLQRTLFKVLFILLLFTGALIAYSWQVYGKVITEKFVRPSTLKEIEELKLSVAKLKLPKEHSPRI